jgi:hypothetical protein
LGADNAPASGSRWYEELHLRQSNPYREAEIASSGHRSPRDDTHNEPEAGPRDPGYLVAARRAIAFVASTQDLMADHPGVRGGIAGSYPIYGRYGRFKYPNWAAKFFADALLALVGEPTPKQHPG